MKRPVAQRLAEAKEDLRVRGWFENEIAKTMSERKAEWDYTMKIGPQQQVSSLQPGHFVTMVNGSNALYSSVDAALKKSI